jgi:hypothetical protein
MNIHIRKYLGTSVLSMALLLASGIPALAKYSRTVNISHDFVLAGKTLPAGEYTVQWDKDAPQATVDFVQHNKLVLSTEGKLDERVGNHGRNAIVYKIAWDGSRHLSEIRFASGSVLVFNQ